MSSRDCSEMWKFPHFCCVKRYIFLYVHLTIALENEFGNGDIAPAIFFTAARDEDQWATSRPDRFIPGVNFPVPIE
jgi:hypothetical protein